MSLIRAEVAGQELSPAGGRARRFALDAVFCFSRGDKRYRARLFDNSGQKIDNFGCPYGACEENVRILHAAFSSARSSRSTVHSSPAVSFSISDTEGPNPSSGARGRIQQNQGGDKARAAINEIKSAARLARKNFSNSRKSSPVIEASA
jgi:hypothetical protein